MFLMQNDSGISKILAKCSFETTIVKHELNLFDFEEKHCIICLNGSTATGSERFEVTSLSEARSIDVQIEDAIWFMRQNWISVVKC